MTSKFLNQAQRELIEKEFKEIFTAVKECCFLEDSIFAIRSIQDTELFKKHCSRFDLFNILEHIYNARSLYNFDWTAAITKLSKEKENAAAASKYWFWVYTKKIYLELKFRILIYVKSAYSQTPSYNKWN